MQLEKTTTIEPEVLIFTDGACSGNPGPGGWACILHHTKTGHHKEFTGAEKYTTNNKMEMKAVIEGLKRLKTSPVRVHVVTDSTYVRKGITEWIKNWKKNNWQRRTKKGFEPVKNVDLWKELDELVRKHIVSFEFVRGHAGHPENERCDQLAVEAYQKYLKLRDDP